MLLQELAEYKAESQELKNQDFTIRKLEETVRELEAQVEEKASGAKRGAALVEAASREGVKLGNGPMSTRRSLA